jgi:signal transduction histidine kinase
VTAGAFSALGAIAAPVAVFSVAERGSRRALAGNRPPCGGGDPDLPRAVPDTGDFGTQTIFGLLVLLIAISLGLFARMRCELVLSLRDRAEQAESEQRRRVEQAREAERRRIAREMHDVLAHRLSLLSVHAGALEFRPDASPHEVSDAAGVIRASARAALQELRDVIGLLRDEGENGSPRRPQPTFVQIPTLVGESRQAGMNVRLDQRVPAGDEVPVALGRTAYRVVQEGLTNARKHAPGAAVDVELATDRESLLVKVVSRPAVGARDSGVLAGTGTGLIGLAERVELTGGELRCGPDPAGDFVLSATLPWPR